MNHWIDVDTCVVCGHEREFNPTYDVRTKDWVCDKCSKPDGKKVGCTTCEHRAKAYRQEPCNVCYNKFIMHGVPFSEYVVHSGICLARAR